jgi:hypothetical protein
MENAKVKMEANFKYMIQGVAIVLIAAILEQI